MQGTFFSGIFKEVFTFPAIFSLLRACRAVATFYQCIALSLDNVLNIQIPEHTSAMII